MRELALHILDLAQNSLAAGASLIEIGIRENEQGFFVFRIRDNGRGMSRELLAKVRDPFVTTRSTRKVGMGIPFIDMVTQQCGGRLELSSQEGEGTELAAYFAAEHIDRPPLGDLAGSMAVLLAGAGTADVLLRYAAGGGKFVFDSRQVRAELGEACDFAHPEVSRWLQDYLRQEIQRVQEEGSNYEKLS